MPAANARHRRGSALGEKDPAAGLRSMNASAAGGAFDCVGVRGGLPSVELDRLRLRLCPADRVCDGVHKLCVKDEQLHSCIGKPDNDALLRERPPRPVHRRGLPREHCGDGIVTGTEQCDGEAFVDDANDCLNVGFYDSGPIFVQSRLHDRHVALRAHLRRHDEGRRRGLRILDARPRLDVQRPRLLRGRGRALHCLLHL